MRSIIACLARNTREPKIQWHEDFSFTIQVDGHDQGRMVGKQGIILWAINTVFWYAGMAQLTHTVKIELLNPENPMPGLGPSPYRLNPNWNRKLVTNMVESILSTAFKGTCLARYELHESAPAKANLIVIMEKYLQTPCSNPDIGEAIEKLVYAGGMVDGGSIKTQIRWE